MTAGAGFQTLLYLYSQSTNVRSALAGWALFDPATADEPVLPSQDAPYGSVLDALRDGWRIVQFPRPESYRFSDLDNHYLGFEFILEKVWSERADQRERPVHRSSWSSISRSDGAGS